MKKTNHNPTKPTKANLLRLAKSLGVTDIDELHGLSPQGFDMSFWAPAGFCWASDGEGTHVIVASQWDDETRAECIQDAMNRIGDGVAPCRCDECPPPESQPASCYACDSPADIGVSCCSCHPDNWTGTCYQCGTDGPLTGVFCPEAICPTCYKAHRSNGYIKWKPVTPAAALA